MLTMLDGAWAEEFAAKAEQSAEGGLDFRARADSSVAAAMARKLAALSSEYKAYLGSRAAAKEASA